MMVMAKLFVLNLAILIFASNRSVDCRTKDSEHQPGWLKSTNGIREQYMARNYGKLDFDRRTGQHPPKGSIVSCSIECFSLPDCHCIEINKQNGNCRFYDHQSRQPILKAHNQTQFLYFTRDHFGPSDQNRIDMAKKAKRTTSNQVAGSSEPLAWIQYEFKKPIYMTGFSFRQTRRSSMMAPFIVRVQNEPPMINSDDGPNDKDDDDGTVCYRHNVSNISGQPQFSSAKKSDRKWIRCQVMMMLLEK